MNILAYLKDIDAEVTHHRQEIAKHQLRIAQLHDLRVLMMNREEERAVSSGQPSPFGAIPNDMEIAVRSPLTYQPEAALAAPALASPEERQRDRKRDYAREYYRRRKAERRAASQHNGVEPEPPKQRPRAGRHRRHMDTVERIFLDRPATPLMTREVLDLVFPDRVPAKLQRQEVYQCLHELKKAGFITQSQALEPYSLVQQPVAEPL